MENNRPNRLSIDTDAKTGESHATIAGTIPQILFNLTVLTASVCDETGITPEMWGGDAAGSYQSLQGRRFERRYLLRPQPHSEQGVSALKMALKDTTLFIKEADNVQFTIIKSWNKMKWSKASQTLAGTADLELLDKLSSIVRLPPAIEARRNELRKIAVAVDRERMNEEPAPFYPYPVKMPLYRHQTRAANMALLTFGWIAPEGGAANA